MSPQGRRGVDRRGGAGAGDEDLRLVPHGGGAQGHGQRDRPGWRRGYQLQRVRLADD